MKQGLLRDEQMGFSQSDGAGRKQDTEDADAVASCPLQEIYKQRKLLQDKLRAVQAELWNSFSPSDESLSPDERLELERKLVPLRENLRR